ncbi:mucin-13 [Apteryx rowi]|uniref:mucin-13 n=1 Tax=Apteryx rowi TaxID=308060 RepID=UPI000E1C66DF|nr:mucin-13 [Apteryx rowi]
MSLLFPPTDNTTATTNTSSPTASPIPGDICSSKPCGNNAAKCVALYHNYTCLCPYGFYHKNMDCHKGLIFPGLITLQQSYSSSIELVNSTEYTEVFLNVTTFFTNAFRDETSFGQTVIVGIQLLQNSRSADTSMSITLMNLFAENSAVTNETVASKINKAAEDSKYITAYRAATYCAVFQCDLRTTVCEEAMYPECTCKSNYSKTAWDDRSCSDCNSECSVTSNKYCAKESGIPTCKCLTNFEMKDNRCVPCAVGYSGENCKNNSELNLIIVGTVLGAIILSFVIAAIFISARSKHKKDSERKSLIPAYLNSEDSGNTQTRMFPRVQTTSGYANPGYQSSNPYEMDRLSSSKALERDYNDEYETTQEPNGFRMQRRY